MSIEVTLEVKQRGQLTLPARIRRELQIKEGDEIVVRILGKIRKEMIPVGEKEGY